MQPSVEVISDDRRLDQPSFRTLRAVVSHFARPIRLGRGSLGEHAVADDFRKQRPRLDANAHDPARVELHPVIDQRGRPEDQLLRRCHADRRGVAIAAATGMNGHPDEGGVLGVQQDQLVVAEIEGQLAERGDAGFGDVVDRGAPRLVGGGSGPMLKLHVPHVAGRRERQRPGGRGECHLHPVIDTGASERPGRDARAGDRAGAGERKRMLHRPDRLCDDSGGISRALAKVPDFRRCPPPFRLGGGHGLVGGPVEHLAHGDAGDSPRRGGGGQQVERGMGGSGGEHLAIGASNGDSRPGQRCAPGEARRDGAGGQGGIVDLDGIGLARGQRPHAPRRAVRRACGLHPRPGARPSSAQRGPASDKLRASLDAIPDIAGDIDQIAGGGDRRNPIRAKYFTRIIS